MKVVIDGKINTVPLQFLGYEMTRAFESSNINLIGYNRDLEMLLVQFKNGNTYTYEQVNFRTWESVIGVIECEESVGKWFHAAELKQYPTNKEDSFIVQEVEDQRKVYVLDTENSPEFGDFNKEEFMQEAEDEGEVYSFEGFQKVFNAEEEEIRTIDSRIHYILID